MTLVVGIRPGCVKRSRVVHVGWSLVRAGRAREGFERRGGDDHSEGGVVLYGEQCYLVLAICPLRDHTVRGPLWAQSHGAWWVCAL